MPSPRALSIVALTLLSLGCAPGLGTQATPTPEPTPSPEATAAPLQGGIQD